MLFRTLEDLMTLATSLDLENLKCAVDSLIAVHNMYPHTARPVLRLAERLGRQRLRQHVLQVRFEYVCDSVHDDGLTSIAAYMVT